MRFERIYHHYLDWEEVDFNMWGSVKNREDYLEKAIKFTGDHKLYGRFMVRVVSEWKNSCENAMTDYYINRRAWVGHAACALAIGCPEDITREAWGRLNSEQQLLANKKADEAIQLWEYNYFKSGGVCIDMGEQMLQGWDS
jgi:hypothetical protein